MRYVLFLLSWTVMPIFLIVSYLLSREVIEFFHYGKRSKTFFKKTRKSYSFSQKYFFSYVYKIKPNKNIVFSLIFYYVNIITQIISFVLTPIAFLKNDVKLIFMIGIIFLFVWLNNGLYGKYSKHIVFKKQRSN